MFNLRVVLLSLILACVVAPSAFADDPVPTTCPDCDLTITAPPSSSGGSTQEDMEAFMDQLTKKDEPFVPMAHPELPGAPTPNGDPAPAPKQNCDELKAAWKAAQAAVEAAYRNPSTTEKELDQLVKANDAAWTKYQNCKNGIPLKTA